MTTEPRECDASEKILILDALEKILTIAGNRTLEAPDGFLIQYGFIADAWVLGKQIIVTSGALDSPHLTVLIAHQLAHIQTGGGFASETRHIDKYKSWVMPDGNTRWMLIRGQWDYETHTYPVKCPKTPEQVYAADLFVKELGLADELRAYLTHLQETDPRDWATPRIRERLYRLLA